MSIFAKHIPEHDRTGLSFEIRESQFPGTRDDLRIGTAHLTHASEITFYVRHENRNAACAKILRESLKRDGLAGPRRPGDKAVAVRHFQQEINRLFAFRDKNRVVHKKDAQYL